MKRHYLVGHHEVKQTVKEIVQSWQEMLMMDQCPVR
jgi:hypothetical protein